MTYEHVVHTPVDWTEDYPIHEIKLEFKFKPSFVEYLVIASARAEVINEVILGDQDTPDDHNEEITAVYVDTLEIYVEETRIHEEDCPLTKEQVKDLLIEWCG